MDVGTDTTFPPLPTQKLAAKALESINNVTPTTIGGSQHVFILATHKSNFYKNPTAKIDIALSTTSDVRLLT